MEKRAEIPFGSVRLGAAVIVDQGFGVPPHTHHGMEIYPLWVSSISKLVEAVSWSVRL